MSRIAYVILCSCLLVFTVLLAGPVRAGDYRDGYYRDGYDSGRYYRSHSYRSRSYRARRLRVWYSSNCCYRKIVRHVRAVRYVRVRPRHRYYSRYYNRPRYRVSYYDVPPRRYDRYDGYADRGYRCHRQRVRAIGAYGERVWVVRTRCY